MKNRNQKIAKKIIKTCIAPIAFCGAVFSLFFGFSKAHATTLLSCDDASFSISLAAHVHSYNDSTHLCECGALDPDFCTVTFWCNYDTKADGDIYIYGLFGWGAENRVKMNWTEGDNWYYNAVLRLNTEVEFKAVHVKGNGSEIWERDGDNRHFTPTANGEYIIYWGSY